MGEGSPPPGFAPLHRHRLRRRQNIPTVSVLVGPASAAEWVWTAWNQASGRRTVLVDGYSEAHVLRGWLADDDVRREIGVAVRRQLAHHCGVADQECEPLLAGRSPWELDELLAALLPVLGCSKQLLQLALGAEPRAAWVEIEAQSLDFMALIRHMGSSLPVPLLRLPAAASAWPEGAANDLIRMSEAACDLDVGVAAGTNLQLLETAATARDVALLREGLLRLEATTTEAAPRTPASRDDTSLPYDAAELARSEAERELYRRLESRPTTRGLFAQNVKLDERFGASPIEVDLLSRRLCLALEVDGYHHFRDAIAYRRDRKKDLLLQELGYLVVRVLASDVVEEAEHVLETIDRAVLAQRARHA
jgi:very-short-patch-repair endonuclease